MLTLQDCLEYCELDLDEIEVIAVHEHLTPIVAAELGDLLLQSTAGIVLLRRFILEEFTWAEGHGRHRRAAQLERMLVRFAAKHPATFQQ